MEEDSGSRQPHKETRLGDLHELLQHLRERVSVIGHVLPCDNTAKMESRRDKRSLIRIADSHQIA